MGTETRVCATDNKISVHFRCRLSNSLILCMPSFVSRAQTCRQSTGFFFQENDSRSRFITQHQRREKLPVIFCQFIAARVARWWKSLSRKKQRWRNGKKTELSDVEGQEVDARSGSKAHVSSNLEAAEAQSSHASSICHDSFNILPFLTLAHGRQFCRSFLVPVYAFDRHSFSAKPGEKCSFLIQAKHYPDAHYRPMPHSVTHR